MKGLVLGVYTESSDDYNEIVSYTNTFEEVDKKFNGQLKELLKATGPFCKHVKQRLIWTALLCKHKCETEFDCISVVDLGSSKEEDNPLELLNQKFENVRCAIAAGIKTLRSASNFEDIYIDPCDNPQSAAEVAHLVLFSFNKLKTKSSKPKSQVHLYKCENIDSETVSQFEKGVLTALSQNTARLLTETPANYMTPSVFAATVTEKFENYPVKVTVRDREWAESMKMGSFLSVANGSDEPPKFVELHYDGKPESNECLAFVGKGITFDSGGISLKPSQDMDKMRADMGGAACVVGTILGAASLKLKINIKGFIALSENLPSGKATKPGDVVFAMNGKSIQVDNTDAEGRLVLADAICYAETFNPKAVIDVATLTGAMSVALGTGAAGVFSNDDELWNYLTMAGYLTGDRVWRFPLFSHYTKDVTGAPLADLNNTGKSRKAGACTAAAFLKEFVKPNTKWMHMDMSCVKENKDDVPYLSSGMSGRPAVHKNEAEDLIAEVHQVKELDYEEEELASDEEPVEKIQRKRFKIVIRDRPLKNLFSENGFYHSKVGTESVFKIFADPLKRTWMDIRSDVTGFKSFSRQDEKWLEKTWSIPTMKIPDPPEISHTLPELKE